MSAPTRALTTPEYRSFLVEVPEDRAEAAREAIERSLSLAGVPFRAVSYEETIDDALRIEDIFPDHSPGRLIRAARRREGLTQKILAERLGLRQHHISEMENDRRPVSRDMARRLAKALRTGYKVFL